MTSAPSLVTSVLGRQPIVAVPMPYIKMLGDCTASTFLAQCEYLSGKSADSEGWFEHSHEAWREELGLSPEQVRRCVRDCNGMVEVRRMGLPARNFYRVIPEGIIERLQTLLPEEEAAESSEPAASSRSKATFPVTEVSPPPVHRQTPQHSFSRLKKQQKKQTDDVQPVAPVSTSDLKRFLEIWNSHRGTLPEAMGLSTSRRKQLTLLVTDCDGDLEKARQLLTDAVKEVAADTFWEEKKFSIDTLLPKIMGKAESYRARQTPSVSNKPITLAEFALGQAVNYRRERYTIEAITDRYIDICDDVNGSARILFNSDDIRALKPAVVYA